MKTLNTQIFTNQNAGMIQPTTGRVKKGDLLVFDTGFCETATLWVGEKIENLSEYPYFKSIWRMP